MARASVIQNNNLKKKWPQRNLYASRVAISGKNKEQNLEIGPLSRFECTAA